jgi:hypothetical protein
MMEARATGKMQDGQGSSEDGGGTRRPRRRRSARECWLRPGLFRCHIAPTCQSEI